MKRLERLGATPAKDWESRRLAQWLFEWDLMQAEPAVEDDTPNSRPAALEGLPDTCVAPVDNAIAAGDIRLIVPCGEAIPVFIAIVDVTVEGSIICIPFGPLSEPATPDELLSGRSTAPIRVLCLWNMRTMTAKPMRDSWVADTLSNHELARLRRAIASYENTGQLPADLRTDAGPPLIHPEDPRREYRYRERERINHALVRESKHNVIRYDVEPERHELPKAAEDHDTYET